MWKSHFLSDWNFLKGKGHTVPCACPQESGLKIVCSFYLRQWNGDTEIHYCESRNWGESAHFPVPKSNSHHCLYRPYYGPDCSQKVTHKTHFNPSAVLWVRDHYEAHFTGEEAEHRELMQSAHSTQPGCSTAGVSADSVVQGFALLLSQRFTNA